jgi:tRNA-dihydrouridine synthase 3
MPEAVFGAASLQHPLLSTRWEGVAYAELGETLDTLPPLERLLRCENEAAFGPMAEALWEAASDADAVAALERLAAEHLAEWEEQLRAGSDRGGGSRADKQVQG